MGMGMDTYPKNTRDFEMRFLVISLLKRWSILKKAVEADF